MKGTLEYLKALTDAASTYSSTRFITLVTVGTILYAWLFVSIWHQVLADIPMGVYTFAGLVLTGSVIKRFAEPVGRPDPGQRDAESEDQSKAKAIQEIAEKAEIPK
jgi:hypothetical protein